MLLSIDLEATAKRRLLDRARYAVIDQVQQRPTDLSLVRRLSNMSRALGDDALWQAALSVSVASESRIHTRDGAHAAVRAQNHACRRWP